MKLTIELDLGLSFLLPSALPQLVTVARRQLIVVGGPSEGTAILRGRESGSVAQARVASRSSNLETAHDPDRVRVPPCS